MAERVVLLHGIWKAGPVLWPLAMRLRAQGLGARTFDYASILEGAESGAFRLAKRLRAEADRGLPPPHIVGHSLGGLVAVLAASDPELPLGRIVCLGSPLAGSATAQRVQGRGLSVGLGRSASLLLRGVAPIPQGREVGVIAGTVGRGVGRLFGTFDGAHDGTVAVAETRVPGLADHLELPSTHTGLVFSPEVAMRVGRFLRTGRFAG